MRKSVVALLFAGLVVAAGCGSRTDDQEEARDIVAKAIRAAGGEEKLARCKGQTWKEKATYHGTGADEQYEASYTAAWPDKIKVEIGEFTLVVNGDKGWVRIKGI
jgi:hypothetical protein